MSLETWVSISTLIASAIAICAVMFRMFANLNTKIDQNRDEFNSRLDENKNEFNSRFDQADARFDRTDARFDRTDARFDRTDAKLDRLDERVYELATGRSARSLIVPPAH